MLFWGIFTISSIFTMSLAVTFEEVNEPAAHVCGIANSTLLHKRVPKSLYK